MKLPVPEEVLTALNSTAENMKNFGSKLDKIIEVLEHIRDNQKLYKQ